METFELSFVSSDDEKLRKKAEYAQRLKQERIIEHDRIVQKQEQKKLEEIEARKWEMVNRYKITDYNKMYENNKKARLWGEVLQYRKDLQEQMTEKLAKFKNEELQNNAAVKEELETLDASDRKFFEYANQVKDIIKSRGGRTTIPLEKVVVVGESNINY